MVRAGPRAHALRTAPAAPMRRSSAPGGRRPRQWLLLLAVTAFADCTPASLQEPAVAAVAPDEAAHVFEPGAAWKLEITDAPSLPNGRTVEAPGSRLVVTGAGGEQTVHDGLELTVERVADGRRAVRLRLPSEQRFGG